MTLCFTVANSHLQHLKLPPTPLRTLGHSIGKVCSVFGRCIMTSGGMSRLGKACAPQHPPTPTPVPGYGSHHPDFSFPGLSLPTVCTIRMDSVFLGAHTVFNSSKLSCRALNKAQHKTAVHWLFPRMKSVLLLPGKNPLHIHSLSHWAIWSADCMPGAGYTVVNEADLFPMLREMRCQNVTQASHMIS